MPSISYKTLYQEASDNVERLGQELSKLKAETEALKDEILHLNDLVQDDAKKQRHLAQQAIEITDLAGIARHLKAARHTPQQWKQRGHLPPVDFPDIKEPLWFVSTIKEQFVKPTRRIWFETVDGPGLSDVA